MMEEILPETTPSSEEIRDDNTHQPLHFYEFCNKVSGIIYGCLIGELFGKTKNKIVVGGKKCDYDTWDFNTDQLLIVMQTIVHCGQFDVTDFATRIQDYATTNGLPDIKNYCMDDYTYKVITNEKNLKCPILNSFKFGDMCTEQKKNTDFNTPLIRSTLTGIFNDWDNKSYMSCMATHSDHRCISASVVFSYTTHCMLNGITTNAYGFLNETSNIIMRMGKIKEQSHIDEYVRYSSEGYFNDLNLVSFTHSENSSYKSMIVAMNSLDKITKKPETFIDILTDVSSRGGDISTNCALSGALMGCEIGYDKLPQHLFKNVKKEHMCVFKKIHDNFFKRLGFAPTDDNMPENCINKEGWRLVRKDELTTK